MSGEITGKTRVLGIIGSPVAHSLSPVMHNHVIETLGLDYVYVPFPVEPGGLGDAVRGLRKLGVCGFNVTVPFKSAVISLLDALSPEAALIGAVNTVVRDGNRLLGHNTDGIGFTNSLREDLNFTPRGATILMVGAGGAAKAALVALCEAGVAAVTVANRTLQRAEELQTRFKDNFPGVNITPASLDVLQAGELLGEVDLLVNTTSVGMNATAFPGVDLSPMKPTARVYDMVYAPLETPLLQAARKRGLRAANGIGMLAAQGEAAFAIWTGCSPPNGVMRKRLLAVIKTK
jgi:shikimate dehydrogenase